MRALHPTPFAGVLLSDLLAALGVAGQMPEELNLPPQEQQRAGKGEERSARKC